MADKQEFTYWQEQYIEWMSSNFKSQAYRKFQVASVRFFYSVGIDREWLDEKYTEEREAFRRAGIEWPGDGVDVNDE